MSDPHNMASLSASFGRAVDLSALKRPAAPSRPAAAGDPSSPAGNGPTASGPTGQRSPYVVDVTDETFEQMVQVSARIPVVVDLWATWCEPCKQLSPVLEKLAEQGHGAWVLAKVDVDANPGVAAAFQVQSIPTVVALAGGRPVAAFSGAQPEPQVREWIKNLLDQLREHLPGIAAAEAAAPEPEPEPEDPRFMRASEALDQGDFEGAIAAYDAILAQEPANNEAKTGRAWAKLFARTAQTDDAALAASDADPLSAELAATAADRQVLAGDSAGAFERLLTVVRRSDEEGVTAAKAHLVALFGLFAPDDPDVVQARRKLAASLY